MERCVIVHYHEVALKRGNRPRFVAKLVDNIRTAIRDLNPRDVRALMGRIGIFWDGEIPWEMVRERLKRVFGVSYFCPAYRSSHSVEEMKEAILGVIEREGRVFDSFAVKTRRSFKDFPLTSVDVNTIVGGHIKARTGKRVDLKAPDLLVTIEIVPREAFFYFEREEGPGGLPVGISGRVCTLISGGIDSPVAAYRMMKRGCEVVFVHFHSYPYLDKTTQEKVITLVRHLTRYQFSSTLYLVPFGEIQREISVSVEPSYRVVLYRRMMIRIAERIAEKERARALVTGESIGQVASQTLENIYTINDVARMPVLRPLIGMDKDEIIAQAKEIGTFETSIIPDQDCCQLFIPRHPATKARVEDLVTKERDLDIEGWVERAVAGAEVRSFSYP